MLSDKLQLSLEFRARAAELVCGNFRKAGVMLVAVMCNFNMTACDKQGNRHSLSCKDIAYLRLLQALASQCSSLTVCA